MLTLHYLSFWQFVVEKLNTEWSRQSHSSRSLVHLHGYFTDCQKTLPWQMWEDIWIHSAGLVSPRGLLGSNSPSLPSFFQMSQNNQVVSCRITVAILSCFAHVWHKLCPGMPASRRELQCRPSDCRWAQGSICYPTSESIIQLSCSLAPTEHY